MYDTEYCTCCHAPGALLCATCEEKPDMSFYKQNGSTKAIGIDFPHDYYAQIERFIRVKGCFPEVRYWYEADQMNPLYEGNYILFFHAVFKLDKNTDAREFCQSFLRQLYQHTGLSFTLGEPFQHFFSAKIYNTKDENRKVK